MTFIKTVGDIQIRADNKAKQLTVGAKQYSYSAFGAHTISDIRCERNGRIIKLLDGSKKVVATILAGATVELLDECGQPIARS